jgi:uncharacterized protein
MLIQDQFSVAAPIDRVWETLQDIAKISTCIPGVENLDIASPDEITAGLRVSVGPLSARFQGQARVIERTPPSKIVALIQGTDKSSSSNIKATFTGTLSTLDQETVVEYGIDLNVRGRLATFGYPVVRGTVKKMAASFATCLQEMLNG